MGRLSAQLLALVIILLPLCLLVALPFVLLVLPGRGARWRLPVAAFGGYLLAAIVTGAYAYAIVPADYTRDHRWTRHPASSSLGEIHAVALERMQHPGAMSPEAAAAWRDRIRQERRAFAADWLIVTLAGLALPGSILGGVAWRASVRGVGRRGRSHR